MDSAQEVEKVPALGVSISVNVSQKVAITLQSFVDRDTGNLTGLLDKMTGAADRLVARYELAELRKKLADNEAMLERLETELARVDERNKVEFYERGGKGQFKPSGQQKQHRDQVTQNIDGLKNTLIPKLRAEIADAEKTAK